MDVQTLTVGAFESNCHLVIADGRRALVVDPCADAETLIQHIEANDLIVAAYLVTHGHMDHLSALAELRDRFPAPIGLHPLDARWAFTPANSMPPFFETPRAPSRIERAWAEGQIWTDAGLTYRILELPGHSPGSVAFYFEKEGLIFSGDVLFAGSVGRTDLPGGDARALTRSLERLKQLPDATRVFSGHGPATTIGREKATNFFLRGGGSIGA